jgi:hypothetical protein
MDLSFSRRVIKTIAGLFLHLAQICNFIQNTYLKFKVLKEAAKEII